MIAHAAHEGASKASKPCRTPCAKGDLDILEARFTELWSSQESGIYGPDSICRLNETVAAIRAAPIGSTADALIKARVASQQAWWTPDSFEDEPEDNPEKIAADIFDQVVTYLQSLGDGG